MAKKKPSKKAAKKPAKKAAKKGAKKAGAKKTASKAKPKKAAKKSARKAVKKAAKKTAKKVAKKSAKKVVKKAAKKASPKKAVKKAAKKAVKAVKKAAPKKAVKKVIKKAETPVKDAFKSAARLVKKVAENIVHKFPEPEQHGHESSFNMHESNDNQENSQSESSEHTTDNSEKSESKDEEEPSFVAHKTHLNAGDKAPYFEGKDQNGNILNSAMFIGKNLILFFYPKDDTETCTKEACNLRDEYKYLSDSNYAVIGVSADDERSHAKFANKYQLPYPLIADTDMTVIKAYDVWGTKKFMGRIYDGILRTTFVIGPDGIIKEVITKVDSANHAQQILGM